MNSTLATDKLADMRMAHLNIVQGIISRLAGFSANAKNFCVTITAALIAVIFDKDLPQLAIAGCAVIVVFLFIDSYYLALERRYRGLYNDVRQAPLANAADFGLRVTPLTPKPILYATLSTSISPFYLALLACMVFFGYCLGDGKQRPERPQQANRVNPDAKQQSVAATKGGERTGELSEQPVEGTGAGTKGDVRGAGKPVGPKP
jgi:hypothetical protein